MIRESIVPWRPEFVDRLWAVVEKPERGKERQRLRAAAALARYDPEGKPWDAVKGRIAEDLVTEDAVHLGLWTEALRPVKGCLLAPLSDFFRDRRPERSAERSLATNLLADYAAEQPPVLADLVMDADERQFAVLFPKFRAHAEGALAPLQAELDRKLPPGAREEDREALAKRQANAAVVFLRMGHPETVWPLLRHQRDPRVRTYLIHRLGPLGADAPAIVTRLEGEGSDVSVIRALILSLGPEEFGPEPLEPDAKKAFVEWLRQTYRTAADPGTHAAVEWLLRQWGDEAWLAETVEGWTDKRRRETRLEGVRQYLVEKKDRAEPQRYVTAQGQTMVVIPNPVPFLMGSPPTEEGRMEDAERRHRRRIGRTFAIAAAPVTKEQFRRFAPDSVLWGPKLDPMLKTRYPQPTCPMLAMTWYDAGAYCNWLSKQEDIPEGQWCYETDPKGEVVRPKDRYLGLTGYRLPTEAEWEYACRAGATTSRFYGESAELLGKYAWFSRNSQERSWPVGRKKPNDLGLFDVHGGVFTWCEGLSRDYPPVKEDGFLDDVEDPAADLPAKLHALRGGAFDANAVVIRCASRNGRTPSRVVRSLIFGIRVARTMP